MHHCLTARCSIIGILLLLTVSPCFTQSFKFAELTGTPINTTGWNFQGAATRGNTGTNTGNGEIILTTAVRRVSGAIFYNTPINLSLCNKWTAEFDFRIAEGSGADGISFCYLENPPVGFVNGGGLGVPADANGLKVAIDTWFNECENQMPKLQIRWGLGYKECEPTQPTFLNNGSELNFIRDGKYHNAKITYDKGNITFSINGKQYLTGFQTFNFKGYFGFTASTGNSTDLHSIKNVKIFTDMPDVELNPVGICSGSTGTLGPTTSNPLFKYTWSPAAGLDNVNAQNPKVTLTHTGSQPLTTKYYLTTENATLPGCFSTDSVEVKVFPYPQTTFATTNLCLGDSVTIRPTTNWPDSISKTIAWQWDFNDPAAVGGEDILAAPIGKYKYKNWGNYNVSVVSTTREGCVKTDVIPVAIKNLPPAGFVIENQGSLCINEPIVLRSTVNFTGTGITRIRPDAQAGTPVLNYNKIFNAGDTVQINYRKLGIQEGKPFYVINWQTTDGTSCTSEDIDTVRFLTQPKPTITAAGSACINAPAFQITGATENSGTPGAGYFIGRGITNPSGIFDPAVAGVGTHNITYVFDASNGCSDSAVQRITVSALPLVNAGPDRFMLPGGLAVLEGTSSIAPSQVRWTPATYLSAPSSLRTEARPPTTQWFSLEVITSAGCLAKDSALVTVLPALTIPNAFSPHLPDGINDVWVIRNLEFFTESMVTVYDRYGQEVYKSKGYSKAWDGKINGMLVPVGVYYYIVDPKQNNVKYSGSLTIL